MYKDYLLEEKMPLFWCAGCGNGITLQAIFRGMDSLGWTKENTVVTTGIGCWGKADDYVTTNSFHGTHGRALPVSTGIALANPDLNVVTLMGDGDGATIGGNHLIHAARRNINLTAILVNNLNYGMTGGQYSGTTPKHAITKTSPYGHVENGFDICKLVAASGAPYVARATVFDVVQLQKLCLRKASLLLRSSHRAPPTMEDPIKLVMPQLCFNGSKTIQYQRSRLIRCLKKNLSENM